MPIEPDIHVIEKLEAYIDNQLTPQESRMVEEHLAVCYLCGQRFFSAQRLARELGPVMLSTLGQPVPPPALRRRIREQLYKTEHSSQRAWRWRLTGRVLNAMGTLAIIALLAFSVLALVQGQLPGTSVLPQIVSLSPGEGDAAEPTITSTITAIPTTTPEISSTPTTSFSSQGDVLPTSPAFSSRPPAEGTATTAPPLSPGQTAPQAEALPGPTPRSDVVQQSDVPRLPGGTIAFSVYNPAPGRETYEIHLIDPDGANHRRFPLDGVSEPALHRVDENGSYQLAYRAWSEPTSPRSLLTSNLAGDTPQPVGGFFEDGQPDWSPTEDRLIFASQRETDRRWRLYTSWADGTAEVNLRREGKSPSFAPDGYRFVFESCDDSGNRCGLWTGNLEHSEYDSNPFLLDPLARSPDWSPVSDQVAYMANPEDNWDLYLANEQGRQRRLTDDPAVDGLPAWSPDGKWLAFLSNRNGSWGIWLLHVASGQLYQTYRIHDGIFTPPARTPYGQRTWLDEQISWSE